MGEFFYWGTQTPGRWRTALFLVALTGAAGCVGPGLEPPGEDGRRGGNGFGNGDGDGDGDGAAGGGQGAGSGGTTGGTGGAGGAGGTGGDGDGPDLMDGDAGMEDEDGGV